MPISDLVLVIMGLLTVAMLAASIGRNLPIPYTVFLVVIGMLLAGLAGPVPALAPLQEFRLTPDLVFFIFLPALIFESALNLDARRLLKDIAPIFVLAAPALLISTALIGVGLGAYLELDLTLALLFGALIAATDPVAVVALFKELGAPPRLTTLVEGESLFNDATADRLIPHHSRHRAGWRRSPAGEIWGTRSSSSSACSSAVSCSASSDRVRVSRSSCAAFAAARWRYSSCRW